MATKKPTPKAKPRKAASAKAKAPAARAKAAEPKTTQLPEAAALAGRTVEANPMLSQFPAETVEDAARIVANTPQLATYSAPLGGAVEQQMDRTAQAVQLREQAARQVNHAEAHRAAVEEQERVAIAAAPDAARNDRLYAPVTNAMQKPAASASPPGYHPDITSPIHGTIDQRPAGTGVAALEDLAPGQDITPCAAVGSCSIRPLPDKPGEPFSAL